MDANSWFESATLSNEGTETTLDASRSSTKDQPPLLNTIVPTVCDDANCNLIEDAEIRGAGIFVGECSNSTGSNAVGVRSNYPGNQHADEAFTVSFDDNSPNYTPEVSDPHKKKRTSEIIPVCNQEGLSVIEEVSVATNTASGGGKSSECQEPSALKKEALEDEGPHHRKQQSVEHDLPPGSNAEAMSEDGIMHSDTVRKHRPFCPWIATAGGIPGWLQTLSALLHQKEGSEFTLTRSPSASIVQVDYPVTSVRRLFTSKRRKSTLGSS